MERYITSGVQDKVPVDVQLFCWHEYDKCKQEGECDYLHVFELKRIVKNQDGFNLVVIHKQEAPIYHQAYVLNTHHQIESLKVYIIDNSEYETMLLASEY